MTLETLAHKMKRFNRHSEAWTDFVQESIENLGCAPWTKEAKTTDAGENTEYWVDVSHGVTYDYDDFGNRIYA